MSIFALLLLTKISSLTLLKSFCTSVESVFLSRSQKNAKMTEFFRNNFSEDRWRKAALKNAFSLLGKQRFQHSAAFFLLAGSLKDAVEASGGKKDMAHCLRETLVLSTASATCQP